MLRKNEYVTKIMNSKRYAHISLIDNLPPHKDGSFNYLINDILSGRANDISISYEPKVISFSDSINSKKYFYIKKGKDFFKNSRLNFLFIKMLSPWINLKDSEIKRFVRHSLEILNENNIDNIVIWGFPQLVNYFRVKNTKLFIVFAQRHFEYSSFVNPYEIANLVIMQNFGQFKLALNKYLQIPVPVEIIPNGVELDLFYPFDINKKHEYRLKLNIDVDDFVVIFPSKFAPHKGAFLLPKLIKCLNKISSKFKLLIVGDIHPKYQRGKYVTDCDNLLNDLNNENIIRLNHGVARFDMANYYNISDISIFPNLLKEGFSMSAIESLSCGIPILASNCGCFPEIVFNGHNGFLLEQTKLLDELTHYILKLFENRELLLEMKHKSRKYAESKLSRQNMLRNFNIVLNGSDDKIINDLNFFENK